MKRRTWQCRIHALEASQRVQKPVRALANLLRQRTEPAVNSNTSGAADILLPIQPPLVRPVRIGSSGDPRMSTRKEIADCLEHAFVISLKTFSIDLQCISNFKAALNDAVDTIYTKSLLQLACASEVCSDNTLLLPQGTSETKRNNYTLPTLARFPAPLWLLKLQRVHCLFHNAFWDITDLKPSDLVAIPVFHMTRSTFDSDHDTSHRATLQGGTGTVQVDAENKLELTCTMRWVILPATMTGNLSPYEAHIVRTQTSVMHNSNSPVANNKDVTNFLTFVQLTKTIAPISNEEQQYLDTVFRDRLKDASSSVHKHMRDCQSIYSKRNGPVPSHDPVAHVRYMLGFLHSYIPFMCE